MKFVWYVFLAAGLAACDEELGVFPLDGGTDPVDATGERTSDAGTDATGDTGAAD